MSLHIATNVSLPARYRGGPFIMTTFIKSPPEYIPWLFYQNLYKEFLYILYFFLYNIVFLSRRALSVAIIFLRYIGPLVYSCSVAIPNIQLVYLVVANKNQSINDNQW